MKLSIQEKKVLYAFACPNHHNTVTRLKWLTALTVDPKAKRWMLGLARKMENEVEEHWYPCFYQQLRMEMAKYYMFNERNANIKSAAPAEPAIILGLNGAPTAGDQFHVIETEQEAREIANKREQLQREQGLRTQKRLTLGDISHRIARGEFHELNVIVKGDTDGSVEALSDSFIKLSTEKVQVNVVNKAVGQISENDVMLASASDAVIVGFQVRPSADARKAADREGVEINTYSIIYDAIDDIKSAMVGMLDKVKKEIVTGQVEVKQTFKISKVGTIAGGLVTEGKVHAKDKARVIRDGIVIRTAEIGALKRYKDDVKEVVTGMECGLSLVNYNDIQEGDVIETFTEIEVEQKL